MSAEIKSGSTLGASAERDDFGEHYLPSKGNTSEQPDGAWPALLKEVAQAPSVDPSPFIRAPPYAQVMLGRRLGHFRIQDRLGEGGMGIVYKAEDENLRRPVALKVLRPRYLEDEVQHQRLVREAQSAAAFNHPNIAAIYEVGQADSMAFIAMEYVDGKPLRSLIQKQLPPEAEVLHYAIEIARGLARAHAAGIVHRDLKPENLLLDRDGHVKILDFGLAKPFEQLDLEHRAVLHGDPRESTFATQDGQILGTPVYMSPEQSDGKALDARSDIYSFGVLLHELLTGHVPSRGSTAVFEPKATSPVALNDTLPTSHLRRDLIRIVQRCLESTADRRYVDGAHLLAALERVGSHSDPINRGAAASARAQWRNRALVVGAGLAALAAVILGFRPFSRAPGAFKSVALADTKPLEHRLTANPPENLIRDAAISPDGSTVAYVDQTGLFLRKVKSSVSEQIQFPADVLPAAVSWFQNSESLLVSALSKGTARDSIWKVSRSGDVEKVDDILSSSTPLHFLPRVSPDGKAYAWVDREGILWKALSGGPSHLIVPYTEGDSFKYVTWSPSSKRIAYVRIRDAKKGPQPFIETVDLLGSTPRIVVQRQELISDGGEEALGWAPDGRLIYGVAEWPPKEPGTTLWTLPVDPDTGEPKGEPTARAFWAEPIEGQLTVSKKGTLTFLRCIGRVMVFVADLAADGQFMGSSRRLNATDRDQRPTDWSPDGRTLAFMSDQNGTQQVFLQELDSTQPRMITSGPAWHTWPHFARDGLLLYWQLLAAPNDEPRQAKLMRVALPDGAPENVLLGGQAQRFKRNGRPPPRNVFFRCAQQSGTCVYGELVWNELRFSSFDPKLGPGKELMRIDAENTPFVVAWDLSPDGTRIALPMEDGRLRILQLDAGKVLQQEVRSKCRLHFATWMPDGNSLYVTATCAGEKQFKLFLVELGGKSQLLYESANQWIGNPVASPDSKHLAFALKPQTVDVYLLEGF